MHHVELLPDPDTEAAVREEWRVLDEAGLPSLARHRSPSNRPHVTLTMTAGWTEDPAALAEAVSALPLVTRLGGLLVLGGRRLVLARAVVGTPALLTLRAALSDALGPAAVRHTEPGRWLPHVTLAHGLASAQVGDALEALGGVGEGREASFVAARHWDAEQRRETALGA